MAKDPEPTEPSRRGRRRRRVGGVLIGLGLLLGLAAFDAVSARRELQGGRTELLRARALMTKSDARGAADAFARATDRFRAAEGVIGRPAMRLLGWIPVLGRSVDTADGLARSGAVMAEVGRDIAARVAALPGGLAALGPREGRLPLEAFEELGPALDAAADRAAQALAIVTGTPDSFLAGPVASARREAIRELRGIAPALRGTALLLEHLPDAFGAETPQRFFFGAQNPAELRGTGGILGAFSILEIDRGRFGFQPFRPIQTLRNLPVGRVTSPGPDYARNYDQFGGAGFWLNVNMTPDFPSAARAIQESYAKVTGERLRGVMAADPSALRVLLLHTGPVEVPRLGMTVSAENVIPFTTNGAYARFRDPAVRKRVLGAVASRVFTRFLAGAEGSPAAVRAIIELVGSGHLRIFATDPELQRALELLGIDGGLRHEGDALTLVQNNAGGNKVDFYLDRELDVRVRLVEGGSADATVSVNLENGAPREGPPAYVVGPYPKVSAAGENVTILNLFCSNSCRLARASQDGEPVEMITGTELGERFFQRYLRIPSRGRSALDLGLSTRAAWDGDDDRGTYRLSIRGQHTIRPTPLRIEVQAPEGMRVVGWSRGVRVRGETATWAGILGSRVGIELTFERPWIARIGRAVSRFLNRPLAISLARLAAAPREP